MTYSEEQELLQLTRENNRLLKQLLQYVRQDDIKMFLMDVAANIFGNRIDGGMNYGLG